MEQSNDEILTKICNKKSITLADKERFADYIQLMIKRTTKRDKRAEKYFDKVVSKSIGIAEIPPDFLGVEKQIAIRETMVVSDEKIRQKLITLKWTFYVASQDTFFVTSDDPVVRLSGLDRGPIIFPISSTVAILMTISNERDLEYLLATKDHVEAINFLTIINAEAVYSPKPERWIYEILTRGLELNQTQEDFLRKIGS